VNKKVLIISSLFISAGIFCTAQDSDSNAASEVKVPVAVSAEQSKITDKPAAIPEENKVIVEGTISEIAADGTLISIDTGKETVKFITTKDFIDEAYMEVGDKVKITGEKTAAGVKLIDYDYIFDEAYETGEGEPEPAAKTKSAVEETSAPQLETVPAPAAPVSTAAPAAESNAQAAEPVPAVVPVPQDISPSAPAATGNSAQ
jgi:hypothetical protein